MAGVGALIGKRTRAVAAAALLLAAALAAGCFSFSTEETAPEIIRASVLIEADESEPDWRRDIEAPKGIDGYELLELAVDGDMEADWFPEFRSHFVKEILGAAPDGSQFWGAFLWSEGNGAWEPLPVGADLFSVKDGHIMAWALVEYDPDNTQLPANAP